VDKHQVTTPAAGDSPSNVSTLDFKIGRMASKSFELHFEDSWRRYLSLLAGFLRHCQILSFSDLIDKQFKIFFMLAGFTLLIILVRNNAISKKHP
jgi:hypothetical protein